MTFDFFDKKRLAINASLKKKLIYFNLPMWIRISDKG